MMLIFIILINLLFSYYLFKGIPRPVSKLNNGRLLLRSLMKISNRRISTCEVELPLYKIYTDLIYELLELKRRIGAEILNPLKELRVAISDDLKFEVMKKDISNGALVQFLILCLITWFFTLASSQMIGATMSIGITLSMIFLQVFGTALFLGVGRVLEKRLFAGAESGLFALYRLRIFSSVGISVSSAILKSNINQFIETHINSSDEYMQSIALRSKESVERWKSEGTPISEELKLIVDELWFYVSEAQKRFRDRLSQLKLAAIFIGILPSYFLSIISLFQFLLNS